MPGFLRGPVSRVTGNAPQVPEKDLTGATVGKHPNSGVPPTLLGILTKYDGVGGVLHKGLQRTGNKKHQPTDSIRAPSHADHRWELLGNYPIFTLAMLIYHYVYRTGEFLLPPIVLFNI